MLTASLALVSRLRQPWFAANASASVPINISHHIQNDADDDRSQLHLQISGSRFNNQQYVCRLSCTFAYDFIIKILRV